MKKSKLCGWIQVSKKQRVWRTWFDLLRPNSLEKSKTWRKVSRRCCSWTAVQQQVLKLHKCSSQNVLFFFLVSFTGSSWMINGWRVRSRNQKKSCCFLDFILPYSSLHLFHSEPTFSSTPGIFSIPLFFRRTNVVPVHTVSLWLATHFEILHFRSQLSEFIFSLNAFGTATKQLNFP